MQIRALVWLNMALASGLVAWAWFLLPFAHGVACSLGQQCPHLSLGERALQAALPGVAVVATALIGRQISSRLPNLGRAVLMACPVVVFTWLAVGFTRSLT